MKQLQTKKVTDLITKCEKYDRVVIGIDPGMFTGVAVKNPGQRGMIGLVTLSFWETFYLLCSLSDTFGDLNVTVVIEDVSANKPVFLNKKRLLSNPIREAATLRKIAQDVGRNKRDADLLIDLVEHFGFQAFKVAPRKSRWTRGKLNAKGLEKLTGYSGRSSQHSRDAAKLIIGR